MPNFIIFIAILLAGTISRAQLPPDAARLLKKLPNQRLSVELVVAKAYLSSDSFQAVKARAFAIEAAEWQALSTVGTTFELAASRSKNDNSQASIFDVRESKMFTARASKYFSTGTLLGVEIGDTQSTLDPANTFMNADKTVAKVTLAQNLWKDAFGMMTRDRLKAGALSSQADRIAFDQAVQDWALGLIQVYYAAWLSKEQLQAAKTNLERRQRLLGVTRVKLNRGTAERPDLLQVDSATLQARASLAQSSQDLQRVWRDLVTSLKLPAHWAEIPAEYIPLELDQPEERAAALCKQTSNFSASADRSLEQRLWKTRTEAGERMLSATKNAYSPELALEGSYGSSGSVGTFGDRSNDAFSAKNPEWAVGVRFKMPLEWYAEKAELARAVSQHQQNVALAEKAKTDHLTGWVNGCARLKTLAQSRELLERSVKNLAERASLEERRFRLGRTTTMNVIMAGDDYSNAELQLHRTRVALNQTAWDLIKLNAGVRDYLEAAVKSVGSLDLGDVQ